VGLTLANPATILSFAAIFAGVGITAGGHGSAALLVFGVFIGSVLWWLVLSNTVATVRTKVDENHMRWINRLSGCILVGFGLLAFVSLYRP
jgi:threonine/homoserine/homoserine lactone efflux protein